MLRFCTDSERAFKMLTRRRVCHLPLVGGVGCVLLLYMYLLPASDDVGRSAGFSLVELREFQQHGVENMDAYRKPRSGGSLDKVTMPVRLQDLHDADTTSQLSNETQVVILFAYMRGGSSFLGGLLENNPDVFYWYEPLWEVYNAMTSSKLMQFPLHVVMDENDHLRNISEYERKYIRKSFRQIFTCDLRKSPVELLTSWVLGKSPQMTSTYRKCLASNKGLDRASNVCQKTFSKLCPARTSTALNNNCHKYMELTRLRYNVSMAGFPKVQDYKTCMQSTVHARSTCMPLISSECHKRPVKAAKILRTRMNVMEDLIKEFPNIKIIHQLRDPRGILVSRAKDYRQYYKEKVKEAMLLCAKMADDIKSRIFLERKYPGVFLTTRYEDLAQKPKETAQKIYSHTQLTMPTVVHDWIDKTTHAQKDGSGFQLTRQNATQTSIAWKSKLSSTEKNGIDTVCREVYELAGYTL